MTHKLKLFLFSFLAFSMTIASAQDACSALVRDALLAVDNSCSDLGRNQACYGNVDLTAEAHPSATNFQFNNLGDIVDVSDISTMELSELNEDAGTWGVAVMSLQADIPNTLPGQNVTFILFGDVAIEDASTDGQTPMQAFYLRTGVGNIACDEAPENGVLIQTPDGVDEVTFNINGADVQIGSTVFFTTRPNTTSDNSSLVIAPIEGSAAVIFNNETYPAVEGTEISLPINEELLPLGRPQLPESYDEDRLDLLPIDQLPRDIDTAEPLDEDDLAELQDRIQNGLAPCDANGLPDCDDILPRLRDGDNLAPDDLFGELFEAGLNCIPFDEFDDTDDDFPICPATDRDDVFQSSLAISNDDLDFDADEDGDGIINEFDACPLRAGSEEFLGCDRLPPDSDNDGITDALDFCPYLAGEDEFDGCVDGSDDDYSDDYDDGYYDDDYSDDYDDGYYDDDYSDDYDDSYYDDDYSDDYDDSYYDDDYSDDY